MADVVKSEERINRLTVGGMCLERDSGGITHLDPVVQYVHGTDKQLQEFYKFIVGNPRLTKAREEYHAILIAELIAWGDRRVAETA